MTLPAYPLREVLKIKEKRVLEQEKTVKEKERLLKAEEEKLKEKEAERDKAKQHERDKLNQLREELDGGTTSPKVQQMKAYLKVVKERVKVEEKKVLDQKEQVKLAENNLSMAKVELKRRRQEVDKFYSHKKDWEKEARLELKAKEESEMDEIGSVMYMTHKRKQ